MFKGRFNFGGRGQQAPDIWTQQTRGEEGQHFVTFIGLRAQMLAILGFVLMAILFPNELNRKAKS